jgi:hypothetical protein
LVISKNQSGYVTTRGLFVHRLIWMHFNGPIPEGYEINHINRMKADNRIENLELSTPSGNSRHAYSSPGGNCRSSLDSEKVRAIRQRIRTGMSYIRIANEFGVSPRTISRIRRRETWTWVEDIPGEY